MGKKSQEHPYIPALNGEILGTKHDKRFTLTPVILVGRVRDSNPPHIRKTENHRTKKNPAPCERWGVVCT